MIRVAFVVQRYGADIGGGAETHCRQLAEHLQAHWQVEVLTTCARDYQYRFENDYEAGLDEVNGIAVRRFSLDYLRSEPEEFAALDEKVRQHRAGVEAERRWLAEIGPYSSELIDYVREHRDYYDLFVFFTYLYATTTLVLPWVADKAILVPTAHDEPPIHARFFDDFLTLPAAIAANTAAELEFLRRRSARPIRHAEVIGVGFDEPPHLEADTFRRDHGLKDYFIYVGRIQKEKSCDVMFENYLTLPDDIKSGFPLVLIGSAAMDIPDDDSIVYLGFVDEQTKNAAVAGARALIMPSAFESLSMVMMESWLCGTPVLANANSEVLHAHIDTSRGGLEYRDRIDFQRQIEWLVDPGNDDKFAQMAELGCQYVQESYSWPVIIDKYLALQHDVAVRPKPRVVFVVQRCGREVNGGAEVHCLEVARRMTRYCDVEILTTTALDYVKWDNHYEPGETQIDDVTVRRFPVAEQRDKAAFDRLSDELNANAATVSMEAQEKWMRMQGPWSPELTEFIEAHREDYDTFYFFTYLYATTWFNLPIVADKAVLLPLAHDEWALRLNMWEDFFALPNAFIFNTPEERKLLQDRFPHLALDGPAVGVGIDRPEDIDPLRFRREFGIDEDFLLYVGRIDEAKGCDKLFDFFIRCREQNIGPEKLVLMGKTVMTVPDHPDIVALGFVAEETKWDALAACQCLAMPSPFESLSIVLLEAWAVGKPVLVNGQCEPLVGQCRRAHGGLWYKDFEEFAACLNRLCNGRAAHVLGRQGCDYVSQTYAWDVIEQAFLP